MHWVTLSSFYVLAALALFWLTIFNHHLAARTLYLRQDFVLLPCNDIRDAGNKINRILVCGSFQIYFIFAFTGL